MVKYFCDRCGEEKKRSGLTKVLFLAHLKDMVKGKHNLYVNEDNEPISDREMSFLLCAKCYNEVMFGAYQAFSIKAKEEKE